MDPVPANPAVAHEILELDCQALPGEFPNTVEKIVTHSRGAN